MSVDPYASKYANLSPYTGMGNNPMAIIDPTGGNMVPLVGYDSEPKYCYTCGLNPSTGGGTGGSGGGGGGGRSSANPFSPNHWSAQYRSSNLGTGGGNWLLTAGNLSVDYGALPNGIHQFGFNQGDVNNYGWSPNLNTPMMDAQTAVHYRTLTSLGLNISSVGSGRNLAQHTGNGDYVQISSNGKMYVPYTNVSYWDYKKGQSAQNGGDIINNTIEYTGNAVGGASLVNGGVKTVAKEYVRQVAINKEIAGIKNAKLPTTYNAAKSFGNKLGVVGGAIIVADVIYNSEVKASHGINAFMTGIAFTGYGAPVAAVWFVADVGTGLISGTSISDRIDANTGSLDWDW